MVRLAISTLLILATAGCVDTFDGSNIQIDLPKETPYQASPGASPNASTQLPSNVHFSIVGIQESDAASSIFQLAQFEIHPIIDLSSPCFIDVGEHVPHPGLHVSQYGTVIGQDTGIPDITNPPAGATDAQKIDAATAVQRMMNIAALSSDDGIRVITSVSAATYPGVAADCTPSTTLIPPPMCTDDDSNKRRLAQCQAVWDANPDFFEGTDRILTTPLNGTTRGDVDGVNPINLAPVGGAQFNVDDNVDSMDAFAIYYQVDGMPDPGNLLFFGRPSSPTRGVSHVHLVDPSNPNRTAEMAVFSDLGSTDSHF